MWNLFTLLVRLFVAVDCLICDINIDIPKHLILYSIGTETAAIKKNKIKR